MREPDEEKHQRDFVAVVKSQRHSVFERGFRYPVEDRWMERKVPPLPENARAVSEKLLVGGS
jgi:hypothetical protein